jgi:hypothetical protein
MSAGFFNPRNAAGFSTDGTHVGEGETFLIGRATFTANPLTWEWNQQTVVDFFQHRTSTGGNSLAWGTFLIDGNNGGGSLRNPTNTPITTTGACKSAPAWFPNQAASRS